MPNELMQKLRLRCISNSTDFPIGIVGVGSPNLPLKFIEKFIEEVVTVPTSSEFVKESRGSTDLRITFAEVSKMRENK